MNILIVGVTALLLSTSPTVIENPPYRWLTTDELEQLLQGNRITQPDKQTNLRTPEEFHRNGRYLRHEDNFEAHGRYIFRDDKICVQADPYPEICRSILLDKSGSYWIVSRSNSQLMNRILIQPIR